MFRGMRKSASNEDTGQGSADYTTRSSTAPPAESLLLSDVAVREKDLVKSMAPLSRSIYSGDSVRFQDLVGKKKVARAAVDKYCQRNAIHWAALQADPSYLEALIARGETSDNDSGAGALVALDVDKRSPLHLVGEGKKRARKVRFYSSLLASSSYITYSCTTPGRALQEHCPDPTTRKPQSQCHFQTGQESCDAVVRRDPAERPRPLHAAHCEWSECEW